VHIQGKDDLELERAVADVEVKGGKRHRLGIHNGAAWLLLAYLERK
jgi:hypothetical protein